MKVRVHDIDDVLQSEAEREIAPVLERLRRLERERKRIGENMVHCYEELLAIQRRHFPEDGK